MPPAAPAPQSAESTTASPIRRYMIFDGDSTSGSWDSGDREDVEALRAKFGRHFAWFRRNSREYVVTDAGVLAELHQAMEPQNEVNRMQSEVNAQQSIVNGQQSQVNQQQSLVNAMQNEANRRQDLLNKIQSNTGDDDLIRKLEAALDDLRAHKGSSVDQSTVNREQAKVNQMQSHVNEAQSKVNEQQHKVNDEQHRVSEVYGRRIQEILDSTLGRNLAQQLM